MKVNSTTSIVDQLLEYCLCYALAFIGHFIFKTVIAIRNERLIDFVHYWNLSVNQKRGELQETKCSYPQSWGNSHSLNMWWHLHLHAKLPLFYTQLLFHITILVFLTGIIILTARIINYRPNRTIEQRKNLDPSHSVSLNSSHLWTKNSLCSKPNSRKLQDLNSQTEFL